VIATATATLVRLAAPPTHPPFTPTSPGLLITLPARALHPGEAFTVALSAANPLARGLTGWSALLRFDTTQLQLVGVEESPLWAPAAFTVAPALGSAAVVTAAAPGRAPGQPPERYRRSSAIPLGEVTFLVRASVPGTYPTALSLGGAAFLAPSWSGPPVAFQDHRAGSFTAGSINVTAVATLGLWAWADQADLFNTARFTGTAVTTRLRAAAVRSWGAPLAAAAAAPTCQVDGPSALAAGGAASAATLNPAACTVTVDAPNAAPVKDLAITVRAGGKSAAVALSVWQPSSVRVQADDAVLNSVLPLNVAPVAAGCFDRYQATRLRARADWANGGSGAGDAVAAADVTGLVTFASNDSAVVLVVGAAVRGVAAGAALVTIPGMVPPPAPALVTVTDAPTCLSSLQPLATTGVELLDAPTPPARGRAALAWRAAQALVWEDSTARVFTVATFSDGATMDVTDRALLAVAPPDDGSPLPFVLGEDAAGARLVAVNASASGAGPTTTCGAFLTASWEVCSRRLGGGAGRVALALPPPRGVANVTAAPPVIAPPSDPAAGMPISMPTAARLSLEVAFTDGTRRDFSTDNRTSFAVTAGATLCAVQRDAGTGTWRVVTAPGAAGLAGGTCTVGAAVAFAGAPPLTAAVTVGVVSLRAAMLFPQPASAVAPPLLPTALQPLAPTLKLLRCDARNFDALTLWPMAVLTDCAGPPGGCPLTSLANQLWTTLGSSDEDVFRVMRGYPAMPGERAVGTGVDARQEPQQPCLLPGRQPARFPPLLPVALTPPSTTALRTHPTPPQTMPPTSCWTTASCPSRPGPRRSRSALAALTPASRSPWSTRTSRAGRARARPPTRPST
jgi:hypothetical protein